MESHHHAKAMTPYVIATPFPNCFQFSLLLHIAAAAALSLVQSFTQTSPPSFSSFCVSVCLSFPLCLCLDSCVCVCVYLSLSLSLSLSRIRMPRSSGNPPCRESEYTSLLQVDRELLEGDFPNLQSTDARVTNGVFRASKSGSWRCRTCCRTSWCRQETGRPANEPFPDRLSCSQASSCTP